MGHELTTAETEWQAQRCLVYSASTISKLSRKSLNQDYFFKEGSDRKQSVPEHSRKAHGNDSSRHLRLVPLLRSGCGCLTKK